MVVSLEAIFLSTFVLMKQNRMSQCADQRASLDLQINLWAEREMTVVLQMLSAMGGKLGVEETAGKKVIEQLSEHTAIEAVVSELRKSCQKNENGKGARIRKNEINPSFVITHKV